MRPSRLRVPPEILRLVMKVRSPYSEALVSGSVAFSIPFGRRAGGTAAPSNRRFSRAGAYFRPSACRRRPRSGFELAAFDWSNPNSEVAASRGKMGRGRCEPARGTPLRAGRLLDHVAQRPITRATPRSHPGQDRHCVIDIVDHQDIFLAIMQTMQTTDILRSHDRHGRGNAQKAIAEFTSAGDNFNLTGVPRSDRTTIDHALIRGLITAFPIFVAGLPHSKDGHEPYARPSVVRGFPIMPGFRGTPVRLLCDDQILGLPVAVSTPPSGFSPIGPAGSRPKRSRPVRGLWP